MSATPRKYYYPQLDSIRGLSFLAVFFVHAWHPDFGRGFMREALQFFYGCLDWSIDVFFVLSSFLLTTLGLKEFEKKGTFSFRKYFLRRALRIWPLYYVLMFFSFIVLPFIAVKTATPISLPEPAWYLFFISNFYTKPHVYFLRFLWTLSVEEQFYLVLGICLLFLQKRLKTVAFLLMGASICYNVYAVFNNQNTYFNTLNYLFDFSAGMMAALALQKGSVLTEKLKALSRKKAFRIHLLLLMIILTGFIIQRNADGFIRDAVYMLLRFIFILFTALFIMYQMVNEVALFALAKNRVLVFTGKISYGLYCLHGIMLTLFGSVLLKAGLALPALVDALIILLLNYFAATLSYYLLESPFLKWKIRFSNI